jgi:nucleoside-diphosphate-sugar epimerase
MKILVTGSEGSLAQMVVPRLQEEGHEIVGIDNFARYGKMERKRGYQFYTADLCDTQAVRKLFDDHCFDVVFHFAALVYGVVGFHKRPADIISDNNLLTINLLKHGHSKIGKFVYLSSSMVYECSEEYPHEEEHTKNTPVMRTSYGLSKYIGERVVQAYHEQYGVKYTIWRPFNIITPFETPEEEGFSHVFTDMIDKIIEKQLSPIPVLGDGEQIRCFTSIQDVADAIASFSLSEMADNEIFNVGNSEPVTVKELVGKIVEIGKRSNVLPPDYEVEFEYLPAYDDDVKKRIPDVSKLQYAFGWVAKIKVDESLNNCIAHRFHAAE